MSNLKYAVYEGCGKCKLNGACKKFKEKVNMVTKYDFNAPSVVKLRDRSKIHKMLNRYSRRKLKHKIESEK